MTFLDLYVPDDRDSRLSQLNPKSSGILSPADNPLLITKVKNLMAKYRTPFCRVDRLTNDLYIMEANSMSLMPERAIIMTQRDDISWTHPLDQS